MNRSNLATYLNDHLAGSVVAVELLEHLEHIHQRSSLAMALAGIRREILEDRQELEGLMSRLDIPASGVRKTVAWMSEKVAEIKLRLDDKAGGPLHLLEALEGIALGIHGKGALWAALIAADVPDISRAALERLIERARRQREAMETLRLQAATNALQADA